jgi:aminotransferase
MADVHAEARRMHRIPFSGIRKIFQAAADMERRGESVIHLEIGRPDFDTPRHIKDAAKQALDDGVVHYTSNYGAQDLRQAIADKLLRENGIRVDPEGEIIVTVGANEGVLLITLALLDPGDEVLIPDPAWPHYFYCAQLAEARPVHVPLWEQNGFRLDPDDLERAITPRTKMVILTTPHNPTGSVLDRDSLERIAELAIKHDLLVVSDEIYEKILYDGVQHFSLAALPGMAERTITLNGFSKAYSMTGWRLGYVAARRHLIDSMIRVHQYSATCANSFAQKGAVAAYRGSQACVAGMVGEFDRRREFLVSALEQIEGIHCVRPQGAFYVFPSIKAFELPSEQLAAHILELAKVAVVPGSAFGEYGEGYLRLAYSNSYENIERAVEQIGKALRQLPARATLASR